MSGNIIITAGVLLAIQLEGIASASPNPVDDLDSLKTDAVNQIKVIHTGFVTRFEVMMNESQLGYNWVAGNDSLINRVKETAEDSIENVNQLAKELVRQGKNEGKSDEYFDCVEEHRRNATTEIEDETSGYLEIMEELQEKAIANIEKCLGSMEKLLEVVEGLSKTYTNQINLCEDKTCISEVLEEAKNIYSRSNVVLNSAWVRSIKIIVHFKAVSRERQTKTEEIISELVKNAHENMKQC